MFVRAPNPIWYLPDLTGLPLNDEYYAFFLTNTLPYLPQAVYRDNQGMTIWTNSVLQFYPNGTLPDNLYFDPALVYRIEIRHGNSQTDALIYEINDFVPGSSNSIVTTSLSILFAENQVSNSNFSQVNFSTTLLSTTPTLTLTVAGTYEFAPGWFIKLTGAGTTTLTQNIYSGSTAALEPNAINYALKIASSGWGSVLLYQRLENNGNIFAGGAINANFLGRAISSAQTVTVTYTPSDTGTPTTLINDSVTTGRFKTYSGTMNLPVPDNTDLSSVAYTDIVFGLPTTGTVEITDVQISGQNTAITLIDPNTSAPYLPQVLIPTVNPEYQQTTEERNLDHLFHYYAESLVQQPKNSLLAGWNFPLNPWQFSNTAVANVAINAYITDQTILIQQAYVTSTTGNNVSRQQAINTNNFALQINAVTATNQFGIVQYIDTATIAPYWGKILSSMVKVRIATINSSQIAMKMRLFYKAGLPNTVAQADPVASWTSGGDPVFAAGYTGISPYNDPVLILTSATEQSFSFNKFTLPTCTNDNMTLGIMFYSITNMSIAGTPDTIFINDVSLVHNDFAIETQPQTFDQVLQACQYYYEKSYDQYVLPGAATAVSCLNNVMFVATGGGFVNSKAWPFGFRFNTVKRIVPTLHLYSTTGTIDNVTITNRTNALARGTGNAASTFWTPTPGTKGVSAIVVATADLLVAGDGGSVTAPTAEITYHYTADARIGI